MNSRRISWEIVIAGLTFVGIAIYLLNRDSHPPFHHAPHTGAFQHQEHIPAPPEPPLPSTIVIDLENLESLKKLENLRSLKNLKNLEIRLKNLDSIIDEKQREQAEQQALDQSLKQLEQELQQIENADFKVKLQNNKVYINKDYDVKESAWSEVNAGVYVYRESFETADLESMDLKVGFGNLNIIGSDTGRGEFIVRATGGMSSAEEVNQNLAVFTSVEPGKASFSVTPKGQAGGSHGINLEATLTLPKDIAIEASTSGGHINVNSIDGSHKFVTSGGHITLDNVAGTTVAKTSGGHITSDEISGDISLSTSGGHIRITNGSGSIAIQTGGGNIELTKLSGDIEAKTSGGNIAAQIQHLDGPLSLSTSAGNISLSLPSSIAADLKAKGTSIGLSDAFNFEGSKTNGNISGTLNGGGVPITISCGYGNVTIKDEQ